MNYHISPTSFEGVLPFWRDYLWPGRQSAIEPFSVISHLGELDLSPNVIQPRFFIATSEKNQSAILGVNSGFRTSNTHFRSRGLWVDESHRKNNIGTHLMQVVRELGVSEGCSVLWSMPRASALPFYLRFGFKVTGTTGRYEFGPHCLVEMKLH